ncbi:MAG: ATP phosphoribosyltransferase regulatory subunit, partial [Euryarchaeota archaeon]|nr:ATP phosphoribosyltransferase regulatory subunit [Euryarchaeota archaeon]
MRDPQKMAGKKTPLARPRGTRDLLPADMRRRRFVESRFKDVAERWGYREVATPAFEPLELFTLKSGEAIVDELYSFTDKGGRSLALRPELTAPVARLYVNELQATPKPLKLYYFGDCFRYERPQSGRYRQFWQFGIELIGSALPEADAEVIALAQRMLASVELDANIHVGSLDVLRAIFCD